MHSDHIGGLTTHDGTRVFPNADIYVAKEESEFWLSPEFEPETADDVAPHDL